jgi:hypothetical protein
MVTSKWSDATATAVSAATENSVCAPPDNDDASAKQADPDVLNTSDLESLLAKKEKSLRVLQDQNATLTFDLVRERSESKGVGERSVEFQGCLQENSQSGCYSW